MINGHEINGAEINGSGSTALLDSLAESVAFTASSTPIWAHILVDQLLASASTDLDTTYSRTLSDDLEFSETLPWGWAQTVVESLEISEAPVAVQVALILEAMGLTETLAPEALRNATLTESVEFADEAVAALALAIEDTLQLTPTVAALWAAILVEQVALSTELVGNHVLTPTLVEALSFADLLARFISGSLAETMELTPAVSRSLVSSPELAETVDFSDSATRVLLAASTVAEELELTGAETLQALYSPTLSEELELTLVALNPSGGVTTWVVNARTGAVTEYENYDFNSFAEMYPHYLGASSTGLYELTGDTDAGTDIIATIRSGYAQFAGVSKATLDAAYIGVRGDGEYALKVITADGLEYAYTASASSMETVRVSLGRGLKARYIAFELVSDGSDFDFESIEFHPLQLDRRV